MKRKITVVFLLFAMLMVLFFTFQKPEHSRDLSELVRGWLENLGIHIGYKPLRNNIHIPEYFIVGLAVCGFCEARGWKRWHGILSAFLIGFLDESVKIPLPGREFSAGDLMRDFFGILLAAGVILVVSGVRERTE